jgi:hypothetical protein
VDHKSDGGLSATALNESEYNTLTFFSVRLATFDGLEYNIRGAHNLERISSHILDQISRLSGRIS